MARAAFTQMDHQKFSERGGPASRSLHTFPGSRLARQHPRGVARKGRRVFGMWPVLEGAVSLAKTLVSTDLGRAKGSLIVSPIAPVRAPAGPIWIFELILQANSADT
jgi:hypothetical protein